MKSKISKYISELTRRANQLQEKEIAATMRDIERYSEDEKTKAYLLGVLLRNNSTTLRHKNFDLKPLTNYLCKQNLKEYYEGNKQPQNAGTQNYNWVITVFAILLCALGIVRIASNFVELGLSSKYRINAVREGGMPLLFGIILMFVAYTRTKHLRKRNRLFLNQGDNHQTSSR